MQIKKTPFIALLIIAIALPVTILLVRNQQDNRSNAAAPDKLEAEGGVLAGNAQAKTDTLASGGSYVELNKQTTTPSPTPAPSTTGLPVIQGYGAHALDGLPSNEYVVTSTAGYPSTAPGTFGGALAWLNAGNKGTIKFAVSGTIALSDTPTRINNKSNFLIDGRGQSITFTRGPLWFEGNHHYAVVNVRHRGGLTQSQDNDDFTNAGGAHDFAYVNVSASGHGDEGLSTTRNSTDYTYQDCLIGKGIQHHNFGSLNADGVTRGSIIRTSFIGTDYRNPQVEGGLFDIINLIIVGGDPTYASPEGVWGISVFGGATVNLRNAYFQDTPRTSNPDGDSITKDSGSQLYHMGTVYNNASPLPTSIATPFSIPIYAQVTPMTVTTAKDYAKTHSGALPHDSFDTALLSQIN